MCELCIRLMLAFVFICKKRKDRKKDKGKKKENRFKKVYLS